MRRHNLVLALILCLAPLAACDADGGGTTGGDQGGLVTPAAENDVIVERGRVFVSIDDSYAWRDPAVRAAGGAQ
jgi:hypothetical protein